jgi:phytoene synthase
VDATVTRDSLARAYAECERMAQKHYENFPVASLLIPKEVRPHVAAVYAFARIADDFADEARYQGQDRIALLDDWHGRLLRCAEQQDDHPVFIALGDTIRKKRLPLHPFEHLLTAFRMDVVRTSYDSFEDVLGYCRYSANPVGQLVLLLFDHLDPRMHQMSDDICTALQLTNFWQDVAVDLDKGRCYIPREDLARFGVTDDDLEAKRMTPRFAELLRFQVQRTREIFRRGDSLPGILGGRLGLEIGLTLRGGMRVLEKIEEAGCDVFTRRPKLSAADWVRVLAKSAVGEGSADQAAVHSVARGSRSNFYYAFFFLPAAQRAALEAVYAFCRRVDDAVDDATDPGVARSELGRWRRELAACYGEGSPKDPIARDLALQVERFDLSREPFEDVIRGVEMDLETRQYETFEDLELYCRRVACAVGYSCIEIFGSRGERSRRYATSLGVAFQLTNILRDLRSDAGKGRLYIPADEMRRFGYTMEDAAEGRTGTAFTALMKFQCERARALFRQAEREIPPGEEENLLAAEIMRAIYRGLLEKIARRPEAVLEGRVSLSRTRKMTMAAAAFARNRWSS